MIIHIDTGEPQGEPAPAADELSRSVDTPLARALQAPVAAAPTPRERVPIAGDSDTRHVLLAVPLGGRVLQVACTEEGLWGYVTTAWLLGGFAAVVRARKAIDRAIDNLVRAEDQAGVTAAAARSRVERAEEVERPTRTQASHADEWRDVARDAEEVLRRSKLAAARARGSAPRYAELFRDVWKTLALVEEELLRDYETVAMEELTGIAQKNEARAAAEWKRYGCYLKGDPQRKLVEIGTAREQAADIRLALDEAQLQALYRTALDLRMRWSGIRADRRAIEPAVKAAQKHGDDPEEQRQFREEAIEVRVEAWRALREAVGATDPVILQIYPRVRSTSLADFRLMMVEALLDAFEESSRIQKDRLWLLGEDMARIEAQRDGATPAVRDAYGDAAATLDRGDYWEAVETYELTVPASAVIADKLRRTEVAKNSAWLHLPVRLAAFARLAADVRRRAFTEPGSFEHAALTHLWDALEDEREKQETARAHRSLAILGAAVLLAPFTGGGSLVAGGLAQAALSAGEVVAAAQEYGAADQLARSTLASVEMTLWTRPSALSLVRLMAARALDVAGAVIPAGRIPFAIDLAMVAASIVIAPPDRKGP